MRLFSSRRDRGAKAAAAAVVCAAVAGTAAMGPGSAGAAESSFKVSRLTLVNLVGEVSVEVHSAPTTVLKFSGPKAMDTYLTATTKGDTLEVRGKKTAGTTVVSKSGGKSGTVIIGESSHVVMGDGATSTVVIGNNVETVTSGAKAKWKLTVMVPKGQPLNLRDYIGKLSTGDIVAPLDAAIDGASELSIGAITSGALKLSGSGNVKIASVDGDLTVDLLGAGDVSVNGGKINDLVVKIEGAGDVTIDAPAKRAKLTSVGSGDIQVASVAEKPKISKVGAGDISIGR